MWPLFSHQKPGRARVVLVVPVTEPGRGCSGDKGSRCEHAEVPGSSEPSGQSHELSLTWEERRTTEGLLMQVKVSLLV